MQGKEVSGEAKMTILNSVSFDQLAASIILLAVLQDVRGMLIRRGML